MMMNHHHKKIHTEGSLFGHPMRLLLFRCSQPALNKKYCKQIFPHWLYLFMAFYPVTVFTLPAFQQRTTLRTFQSNPRLVKCDEEMESEEEDDDNDNDSREGDDDDSREYRNSDVIDGEEIVETFIRTFNIGGYDVELDNALCYDRGVTLPVRPTQAS